MSFKRVLCKNVTLVAFLSLLPPALLLAVLARPGTLKILAQNYLFSCNIPSGLSAPLFHTSTVVLVSQNPKFES